jgi:hypothetical protein
VNTGVLLRMVRILSVLIWRLNKRLRSDGKTASFDMDSDTINGGILQVKEPIMEPKKEPTNT